MAAAAPILVIDDDAQIRYSLARVLTARGFEVLEAGDGREGIRQAEQRGPAVIFLDNRMEGLSGIQTLQLLRSASPASMVILMTAFATTQTAIEAMKFGAFDYIVKPFDGRKLVALAEAALQAHDNLRKAGRAPVATLSSEDFQEGMVGASEAMREVFKTIGQVAASDVTVMITGESGTGKELVARGLVRHSLRDGKPFVAVNCAAIPESLIESELFGHERGAFTGATAQRAGKFELCDGGTIFLDEIGDMTLATQTKILRALQEGEIQRVGGTGTIKVNVRLIAATNKDLEQLVRDRSFREDLYYRLNVVRIRLPALRERVEDIPQLADYLLQRMARERRIRVKRIADDAMDVLIRHRWPGNVRELENAIMRAAVVAQGDTILLKDLPQEIVAAVGSPPAGGVGAAKNDLAAARKGEPLQPAEPAIQPAAPADREALLDALFEQLSEDPGSDLLSAIEKAFTIRALRATGGNQVRAAALLGMTRTTLRKRQEEWNLR